MYDCAMAMQSYAFGPFVFDMRRRILLKHGSPVAIGQRCAALLETLLAADGRVVSRSDLMNAAWQTENIEESNLAVQIAALRKCLGRSKSDEEWIATVQRVGYQFVNPGPESIAPAQATDDRPSVAVLPFTNMSSDPEQNYFSDGVSEDIITELSRWRLLSVQSRSASFRYRGMAADVKKIACELNVRYIVEGSVRRIGERIRIAVQLIDTESGNHIWAERFDRGLADFFAVQDQVVRTIVSTLVGRVEVAAAERASRKPPASLLAYECVLKGNALRWDDPAGAAEATRLFARAIEMDPGYGFAHAMLAIMTYRKWEGELSNSGATLDEAYRLANRAVELDSNESTCFAILGQVCVFRRSHDVALQYMRRAVAINPNNQWNTADLGMVLTYIDQVEALACFDRAREIDPYFDPPWYWYCRARACMVLHRYEEALTTFEHLQVRTFSASALMAGCHASLGDTDRAAAFARECLDMRPEFRIAHFMSKQPYKNPADAAHLAGCLRGAGLPE
ncbi:winged helix-turn-helix domain-containing tetratricopeptide repeat protein [soil metagenome]